MTTALQARVDDELAKAARARAAELGVSVSRYLIDLVRRDMDAARRDRFWSEVERTMSTSEAREDLRREAEVFAATLRDGLDS